MSKAIIITFHCVPNYGAMLQAYAMQQNISKFVDEVSILNYRNQQLMSQYKFLNFSTPKSFLSSCLNFPILFIKYNRFYLFYKKNLKTSGKKITVNYKININADYVFLGSDQIWNFNITKGIDRTYFGLFHKNRDCKIISYAPSIGKVKFNKNELHYYKKLLQHIHFISVREAVTQKLLQPLCDNEIKVVLDPTFLLEKNEWLKIAKKSKNKKYVLIYSLNDSRNTYNVAEKIAKEKNLKIYEISAGGISFLYKYKYKHSIITCAGPSEFLGLIASADYVVTDSFHGTAFSIIFNKNFYTVPHKMNGIRIIDLLEKLDLKNRIVDSFDNNMIIENIDYTHVSKRLNYEKKRSISFIKGSTSA